MSDDGTLRGRELMKRAVATAMARFGPAIYPIFAFPDEVPIFIGTCFAIEHRGRKFLVTAAHVMDNHHEAPLAVGVQDAGMYAIEGFVYVVDLKGGDRGEDPFDFAWHELTTEEALGLATISTADLEDSTTPFEGKVAYTATGYPLSRNKKISPDQRKSHRLAPMRVEYTDFQVPAADYFKRRGMAPETHIAIKRGHRSINVSGQEENTIGPKGMSGGPLVDIGLKEPFSQSWPQKVVGILIENDEDYEVVVAVRLSVVLEHIDGAIASEQGARVTTP
jgi:hypothetical protein